MAEIAGRRRGDGLLLVACVPASRLVAAAVGAFGYERVRTFLVRVGRAGPAEHGDRLVEAARARRLAAIVRSAAARGPFPAACVPRSLLLWRLLHREGLDATLRIGVKFEGKALRAHAWIEHRGVPLPGDGDTAEGFATFDRDFGSAGGPAA